MVDIKDGESVEVKGSAREPYLLQNIGGVYSCTCPAWRNQTVRNERRTCKHLRELRGEAAEQERLGAPLPERAQLAAKEGTPSVLLAHSWDSVQDPTGWWISEKLKEQLAKHHEAFTKALADPRWQDWFWNYKAMVERVQNASRADWSDVELQRAIWEDNGITTIGPGSSVTVLGAYEDPEVVDALWEIREKNYPQEPLQKARAVDKDFRALTDLVHPKHTNTNKIPRARLLRALAALHPAEVCCVVSRQPVKDIRRFLHIPVNKLKLPGQNAMISSTLREFLGEPADIDAQIKANIFSWYLFERLAEVDIDSDEDDEPKDVVVPRLSILPFAQQRKGLSNQPPRPREFVVRVVRETENGVSRDELAKIDELSGVNSNTLRSRIQLIQYLGLIKRNEAKDYVPTVLGIQLIEDEDPADVIVPLLLERIFGFAQILWDLKKSPEGLTRKELFARLQKRYPNWQSAAPFRREMAWLKSFGMWDMLPDKRVVLTERGEYWASGVPKKVGEQYIIEDTEEHDELDEVEDEAPTAPFVWPSYADVAGRFAELASQLVYPETLLAEVHAALHSSTRKRFVILSGLSGTGKTELALAYARAYCRAMELEPNQHSLVVPVRPDWTDPTGLLGYFNPLSEVPRYEETKALRFLIRAHANPTQPFFLCLDEMNLARPEYYFAPFLSAMETGGRLSIHAANDDLDAVPPHIRWPGNLFIFGTVNMDETTFPFSDKVLDRAFTFELWDVDLDEWAVRNASRYSNGYPEICLPVLKELHERLYPVRRHFGYRTCNEFTDFVTELDKSVPNALRAAFDAAILTKVLPKLRGDDAGGLDHALSELLSYCKESGFPRCVKKLEQLQEALRTTGIARFFS